MISPDVGYSKPAISRSSVVLPQPGRPEQREELVLPDRYRCVVDGCERKLAKAEYLGNLRISTAFNSAILRHTTRCMKLCSRLFGFALGDHSASH
jgi:hypothetical protein